MKIVKHITIRYIHFFLILSLSLISFPAISAGEITDIDLTGTWPGITALIVFIFAYVLVIGEETIHLRKSKPVIVAAGIIWFLVQPRPSCMASAGSSGTRGSIPYHTR